MNITFKPKSDMSSMAAKQNILSYCSNLSILLENEDNLKIDLNKNNLCESLSILFNDEGL